MMPDHTLAQLGGRMRKARKERGFTQEQLSDQSGISVRHIAKIEKGAINPSFEVLSALIAALYYLLLGNAALSTLGARVVSASFNYLVNKRLVFRSDSDYYTPLRYFGLAVAILALNAALMFVFADVLRFPALLVKVLVECGLYCLSFVMQNNWAHRGKKKQ